MTIKDNVEKQIKRNIYGKPQSILVVFPPGLVNAARDEAQYILDHLWFQNKFTSEISIVKNALRIDQIHMSAVMELMMRGQCFSDIRLIISEGKAAKMESFERRCEDLPWDYFLSRKMSLKIKVDVGVSPALHEGGIKEMLTEGLSSIVADIVSGEGSEETTTLYVDAYKYHVIMSISLAGSPLFKRGYRTVLSKSAPLREDIAASCIQSALQFGIEHQFTADSVCIPFSGTGTFLIEYWMTHYQFAPVLFDRAYAIQSMPLFRADTFNYLHKKAREHCAIDKLSLEKYACIDNDKSANDSLLKNIDNFKCAVEKNQFNWPDANVMVQDSDFLTIDAAAVMEKLTGNIFLPLNPPYGIRLEKSNDVVARYKKIAEQMNALAGLAKKRKTHLAGFVLCPSEEAWSSFCKTLKGAVMTTYHMTQGGLDIRVAQFYL